MPGDLGRRAVGLLQPGQRLGQGLASPFLIGRGGGQLALGMLAAPLRRGQPGSRLVGRGLRLQQARRLGESALSPVRTEQVAVPGDHPQDGVGAHQVPGLAEIPGHHDVAEQPGQRPGRFRGSAHQVKRGPRPRRQGEAGRDRGLAVPGHWLRQRTHPR